MRAKRGVESVTFDHRAVDALEDGVRRAVGAHWRRRVRSELQVGRAFAAMAPMMRAQGAAPIVVSLLERGASDEERHAGLCHRLAELYLGEAIEPLQLESVALPRFGRSDERVEVALLVLGMCCINETLATAWIERCLSVATVSHAKRANREHLRDEVNHARLGWAHLASSAVTASMREEIAAALPAMLDANVAQWLSDDPSLPAEGVTAHGHPSAESSREAIDAAVSTLLIPGFSHVNIDVRAARRWAATREAERSPR